MAKYKTYNNNDNDNHYMNNYTIVNTNVTITKSICYKADTRLNTYMFSTSHCKDGREDGRLPRSNIHH